MRNEGKHAGLNMMRKNTYGAKIKYPKHFKTWPCNGTMPRIEANVTNAEMATFPICGKILQRGLHN